MEIDHQDPDIRPALSAELTKLMLYVGAELPLIPTIAGWAVPDTEDASQITDDLLAVLIEVPLIRDHMYDMLCSFEHSGLLDDLEILAFNHSYEL
tara:strand:- start:8321 stop:8605 length:285 start_codon:yes stop_codon:yes gene_type:complete